MRSASPEAKVTKQRGTLQQQVRLINHYGLRPMVKEDREKMYVLTRDFFGLPPAA